MIRYLICIGLCAVVWIVNIKEITHAAKIRMPSEIFIHAGLGLFFSIMIIEWTLGTFGYWEHLNIFWLKIIGFILFIPSAYLEWTSHEMLKHKASPEGGKLDATTVFVDSGIYSIVRQPMTLGMAVWSIAEVTWERSWTSRHHMAKRYRNAKVIGITTREGDRNIFVVANRVAADWEKALNKIPGFRALN